MDSALAKAFADRRVLVTGGAGVIAGELLAQLSEAGARVLSVDRLPLAAPLAGVEHLRADLGVADLAPLERFRPEHVFHLAATFERSVETPEFWEQNWNDNTVVTHRLVELADRVPGLETFIFASSYLIYDPALYSTTAVPTRPVRLREDVPIAARNLTGAAKLYGEAEVRFMREVRQVPFRTVNARIFRVYGRGSRDVVSRFVRASLAGERVVVYHPENHFDYVFSGDVAEGLLRMAAAPAAEGILNLASGRSRSVASMIAAVEAATGRRLDAERLAVDEPFEASEADLDRLRAAIGWTPPTLLEDGVARLVAFERARGGGPA